MDRLRLLCILSLLVLGFGSTAAQTVLINEINYHAAPEFDTKDWLELHNPGATTIDVSGWTFSDEDDANRFVLPAGTLLPAGGFLVLCRDAAAFAALYTNQTCLGDFPFNLANGGELLRLLDAGGTIVNAVNYDDEAPWPTSPDGSGPTLELTSSDLDNTQPTSWQRSLAIGGTPGVANGNETPSVVVINEINYNSVDTFDPRDWIELHNPATTPVDVSGWIFRDTDSDTTFVLPPATQIAGGGFLVLCRDAATFQAVFSAGPPCAGAFGFSLSNGGEKLQLWDAARVVVDSLTYDDMAPWTTDPDGNGPTLELVYHGLDNSLAESWGAAAVLGGTPGAQNSIFVVNATEKELPTGPFRLGMNYPNPFSKQTAIPYALDVPADVTLHIFNTLGQEVHRSAMGHQPSGTYTAHWTPEALHTGVYFYHLMVNGRTTATRTALLIY